MANRSLNAGRADSRTNRDARGDSAPRPLLKPLANFLCGGGSIVISLLLFVVVVGVFLPSLRNGFVNLDDDVYVFANPHVQSGLSWENIRWAFGNFHAGFWHPLTWLSLMLDRQLFGLRPFGFHLTAVLLHAASTGLLFVLFRRMTGATWRSAFVALLFGLHPLHVEPVAWVADRKDVLSAFFGILSLLFYVRYAQKPGTISSPSVGGSQKSILHSPLPIFYLFSLLFFTCGLMSKTMVVTLPFIMLLIDWWPLRRFQSSASREADLRLQSVAKPFFASLFFEKVPFLAVAFVSGLLTIRAEQGMGALANMSQFPMGSRIANAFLSYVRYLAQTVWPHDLVAFYPYPDAPQVWPAFGAALLFVLAWIAVLWALRRKPYLAFGWAWYVVTLLPVAGLIQVGSHSHADRYTYLPLVGLFVALVWGLGDLTGRWRYRAIVAGILAGAMALACVALTRRQIGYWKDSETLFRHALAGTQNNQLVQNNLGAVLGRKGLLDEAVGHLQEAVRLSPEDAGAHCNLGDAFTSKGLLDEAIGQYQQAIRLKPDDVVTRYNLGNALAGKGRIDEAIAQYREAIKLNPGYADAHNRLGTMLGVKDRLPEAVEQFQEAIKLKPDFDEARCGLGIAFVRQQRFDEAIEQLQEAVRLSPDYAEARCHLGVALGRKGRLDEAISQLRESVRIKPGYADAQENLRTVLAMKSAALSPAH